MLATLVCLCAFQADEPSLNGTKLSEWLAMAKDDAIARKRKTAVIALGQMIDDKTRDTVLLTVAKVLRSDSQAGVRLQAALVLGQQPAETLAGYLSDLTEGLRQEKDPAVKCEIAISLGRLGKAAQAGVLPLIDALKDAPVVQIAAAEALGRIGAGANTAVERLLPLLADKDAGVRQAAVFALGRIEPADPDAVVAAFVQLLAEQHKLIEAVQPHSALAGGAVARSRNVELIATTVVSFGLLGAKSREAALVLARQFHDPDPDVRQQAALALSKLGIASRPAENELKAAIAADPDRTVRIYAIHAFAAIWHSDSDSIVALFIERLKAEKDLDVRIVLIEELGGLGADGRAAIVLLKDAQRDTQLKVREAATLALRRITKPATVIKP